MRKLDIYEVWMNIIESNLYGTLLHIYRITT